MKRRFTIFGLFVLIGLMAFGQPIVIDNFRDNPDKLIINGEPQIKTIHNNYSYKGNCDTVFSFITPTDFPLGVAWDGHFLWHTNANNKSIFKIDTLGNVLDTIIMPEYLSGLEFDGTDLLGVCEQSKSLYKINISNGSYLTFPLPAYNSVDPNDWGICTGGGYLWVSEYGEISRLYKIDPTAVVSIDTVLVNKNIMGIKWLDNYIYAMNYLGQKVFKIDPATGFMQDSADWCVPKPYDLTIENKYIWNVSGKILYGGEQKIVKLTSDFIKWFSMIDNDISENQLFSISPNPASDKITIDFASGQYHYLTIYNLVGDIVMQSEFSGLKKEVVDIKDLSKGIYVIQVTGSDWTAQKKIVKE